MAVKGKKLKKEEETKKEIINENYFKCRAIFMNRHLKGRKLSQENLGKGDHYQGNTSFHHTGPNHPFISEAILQRTLLAVC